MVIVVMMVAGNSGDCMVNVEDVLVCNNDVSYGDRGEGVVVKV